jgi:integrase
MAKRKTNKHLPPRVYEKHGAFYLVTPENKWVRLGKTESDMYAALARINHEAATLESGLSAVIARYRDEVVPTKSERTQKDNLKELDNLDRSFGAMDPAQIKPIHIYQYLDLRGKTAMVRANREIALLSHVFSYAIRWGIVETNPCREVKKHSEKPRERYVEDWEYLAVLAIAPPLVQAAMEIAAITGMRQADILSLSITDLRDDGIPVIQNKTRKKQIFEWTPALREAVDKARSIERPTQSLYLFSTSTGRHITSSGFQTAWQRLMAKAIADGVIQERFTFHDLRAKAGSESDDGTKLLGHQSPATTRRVYHRRPEKVKPIR